MATVNLGRIKPVFRGAYDNSTAYVIDDIVTSGNETFIAIAATQGNATTDASKWTKLAAKGADGTDVAATLANKEIAFKTNAGALDGIPIGSAGEFLKVNSGATGYEFGAVTSADVVKIAETTITGSSTTAINFDQSISSTYKFYKLYGVYKLAGSSPYLAMRWRQGSSGSESTYSSSTYRYINDAFHDSSSSARGNGQDSGASQFQMDNESGDAVWNNVEVMFNIATAGSAIEYPSWNGTSWQWRESSSHFFVNTLGGFTNATITPTGFHFFNTGGGNFVADTTFKLYGVK